LTETLHPFSLHHLQTVCYAPSDRPLFFQSSPPILQSLKEPLIDPANSSRCTSDHKLIIASQLPQLHHFLKVHLIIGLMQENKIATRFMEYRFGGLRRTEGPWMPHDIHLRIDSTQIIQDFRSRIAGVVIGYEDLNIVA
jgi:hypothetical protein